MKRVILTHVGISALSCSALEMNASFNIDWLRKDLLAETARQDHLQICVEDLTRGLSDTWTRNGFRLSERREESPAEIAALSLITVKSNDIVMLVHSATAAGRFCAELLKRLLTSSAVRAVGEYPRFTNSENVLTREVDSLRITDDTARDPHGPENGKANFVSLGVPSYVDHAWEAYTKLDPGDELVFNITGGYKGLIPVARDVSTLLAARGFGQTPPITIRMCYLFQTSSDLIWHDPLPFTINWSDVPMKELTQAATPGGLTEASIKPAWRRLFEPSEGPVRKHSTVGAIVQALAGRLNTSENRS
jgi:hypothetical protein